MRFRARWLFGRRGGGGTEPRAGHMVRLGCRSTYTRRHEEAVIPWRTRDLREEAIPGPESDLGCLRRTRFQIDGGSRRRSILQVCAGASILRMELETGAAMTRVRLSEVDMEEGGRMDRDPGLCYRTWTSFYRLFEVLLLSVKGWSRSLRIGRQS